MSEPVKIGVVVPEGDCELATMHMLVQVMSHMLEYESLRLYEARRIATWFASRYAPPVPGENNEPT